MAVGILEESLACAVTKELLNKDDAAQILAAAQSGELSRYLLENGVRLDLPLAVSTHWRDIPVDRCVFFRSPVDALVCRSADSSYDTLLSLAFM